MLRLFLVPAGPNKPAVNLQKTLPQSKSVSDLQEVVSLKERMARYQQLFPGAIKLELLRSM